MLINLCKENNYKSIFPPIELCGDNAAMIAFVGLEKFKLSVFTSFNFWWAFTVLECSKFREI